MSEADEKLAEAIREAKCIDYDKAAKERYWWLNKTGGSAHDCLTVLDTFAVAAMQSYVSKGNFGFDDMARWSYKLAAAMMDERTKQESNDA